LLIEVDELKSQPDPLTAYLYAAELAKDDIKRLKAEVERLTQAAEWQPIQTAPKNYTKILCLWPIKTAYRDSKGYWSRDEMNWWDKHEGELPEPILWKPLPEGWDDAAKEVQS